MPCSIRTRSDRLAASAWLGAMLAAALAVPAQGAPKARKANEIDARTQFTKAQKAYDLGQFGTALAGYTEAYRLDERPPFLFNIAQCHRQLGNYEQAAFFYRRYLDQSKKRPPNADQVESLLREVETRQAEALRQKQLLDEETRLRTQAEEGARREAEARAKAEGDARRAQLEPVLVLHPADGTAALARPGEEAARGPEGSVLTRWWFWTGVGVVAAAAGGTAYGLTRPKDTTLEPIHAR